MHINTWDCLPKKLSGMALQICWFQYLFGKERQEELKLKVFLNYIGNWRIYETLSQENRQKLKPAEDGWWYSVAVSAFTSLWLMALERLSYLRWLLRRLHKPMSSSVWGALHSRALLEFFTHPSYRFSAMSLNMFFYVMRSTFILFYYKNYFKNCLCWYMFMEHDVGFHKPPILSITHTHTHNI